MTVLTILHRAVLASILGFVVTACSQAGGETEASAQTQTAEQVSEPAPQYDLTARFVEAGVEFGAEDAPVTIIEYASLTCGGCKQFHEIVMPTIKQDYIKTGKVKFILREFPTPPKDYALAGFAMARCVGEENHMAVVDDFFASQPEIFDAARAGQGEAALKQLGSRHGLSESEFEECVTNLDIRRQMSMSIEAGKSDGVRVTPTLFMNGKRLGSDAGSPEGLSRLIDEAIAPTETITAPEGEQ